MKSEEYFFYEWLIIGKGITDIDKVKENLEELKEEYRKFCLKLT